MNLEWIAQKGTSLMALVIGLGFIAIALLYNQYMYFFFCLALIAFIYGYKQFRKRDTPFQKRERELRRKTM
jgi:hypothetical protein